MSSTLARHWANRRAAGVDLGNAVLNRLQSTGAADPGTTVSVWALPAGGVVVAVEVVRVLRAAGIPAALGVLPVARIRLPQQPEVAVGAVAGLRGEAVAQVVAQPSGPAGLLADMSVLQAAVAQALERLRHLQELLGELPAPSGPVAVTQGTVVVVDDGVATGWSALAGLDALHAAATRPDRRMLAVPVAPRQAALLMRGAVDDYLVLTEPLAFRAVSSVYDEFEPVDADALRAALAQP